MSFSPSMFFRRSVSRHEVAEGVKDAYFDLTKEHVITWYTVTEVHEKRKYRLAKPANPIVASVNKNEVTLGAVEIVEEKYDHITFAVYKHTKRQKRDLSTGDMKTISEECQFYQEIIPDDGHYWTKGLKTKRQVEDMLEQLGLAIVRTSNHPEHSGGEENQS